MMRDLRQPALLAAFVLCLASVASTDAAEAPTYPIVAGFERLRGIEKPDPLQQGQLLLSELGCIACHQPADASLSRKQAPILDGVGTRVRVSYLKTFLADPQACKPGTTMPSLLAGDPDKSAKVEALVHFLASTGTLRQTKPDAKGVLAGRDTYHKVGCVACHGPRDAAGQALKTPSITVPLGDLKAKYSVGSLAAFLDNPLHDRPSARMPQLVKGKEAKDIASYLLQGVKADELAKGNTTYTYYEGAWAKLPDFEKMKPKASGICSAFSLSPAKRGDNYGMRFEGYFKVEREGEYRFTVNSDDGSRLYIDGKPVVDNDGTHPPQAVTRGTQLSKGVHKVTVAFFQAGGGAELDVFIEGPGMARQELAELTAISEEALAKRVVQPKKDDPDFLELQPALVEKGKGLFTSLGCASCHQMTIDKKPLVSSLKATPLEKMKVDGGCLAATPGKGVPSFGLSAGQRAALTAAVRNPVPGKEPGQVIARTLTTFNCYACHVRGTVGGVDPEDDLSKAFQTTQPEMGDEARIPPPLTGVGAKLNPEYLKQILDKGSHDRPYMHTHMPAFGLANVGPLADAFIAVDKLPEIPEVTFTEATARVRAAGRHLVGSTGLGCIKCHTFGGHKAEGVQGIDMLLMPQRLKRDWFFAYLMDPMKIRPGTRMPAAWPDGKSPFPELLGGKSASQIEAIWGYLSTGKGGAAPVGVGGKKSILLVPEKTAIIYRNFIQGAGTRGIAVGYPEKAHLAFDANQMCLAMIWQGAFFDAGPNWTDRGSGYEPPAGDNILRLHVGAPFAVLEKPDAAWPATLPKDLGYVFKGYDLAKDERPTFLYKFGDVKVEDFPNAVAAVKGKDPSLHRTLKLTTTKPVDDLYFRAAVGTKIESSGNGWFTIDGWKMKIESAVPPRIRQSSGKAELLVPIRFADGKAQIVQEFHW